MPKVYLSPAVCAQARDKLVELLEATTKPGVGVQHRAAHSLASLCQTQGRYRLKPETEADFTRAAKRTMSAAQQLERMTPEELIEEQKRMLGDDYPGFPA